MKPSKTSCARCLQPDTSRMYHSDIYPIAISSAMTFMVNVHGGQNQGLNFDGKAAPDSSDAGTNLWLAALRTPVLRSSNNRQY